MRVSTLSTTIPPFLAGGSSTRMTVLRGVTSTPKSFGVMESKGFFLACKSSQTLEDCHGDANDAVMNLTFIIFGSVAYRGSFSLKSADITAGRGTSKHSVPESVSLSTLATCRWLS